MIRVGSLLLAGVLAVASGGCGTVPVAIACDLTLVAVAPDEALAAGDPLPADRQVIAAPDEFDLARSRIVVDAAGGSSVDLVLQGAAIPRLAAHTAAHIGEPMAIALGGEIVALPFIMSAIDEGAISIATAPADAAFVDRLAGCVPTAS